MLSELKNYTETNGMKLNIKKTKVMIFNKTGRHMRRNIYFGTDKIETTREYKYLGFKVTPSGEITSGLKDLKDRAMRAFAKTKKKLGAFFRTKPEITLKIFKSLIIPILLYASDFWGILNLPANNPIETVHMSFCKQLLGVQKCTTNIGVLLELGEIPLMLYAKKNALKNWSRIANKLKCNDLTSETYESAIEKDLVWPRYIENTITKNGLRGLFLVQSKDTHTQVFQRMKDIFLQESFSDINSDNSKLRTYGKFKQTAGYESYLNDIKDLRVRSSFTKLRLSNHELMIEKGRHQKKKLERYERVCPFCPLQIEDEIHFLLECSCYQRLRGHLFTEANEKLPNFKYLQNTQKFFLLMNNQKLTSITPKYIHEMMETRKVSTEAQNTQI